MNTLLLLLVLAAALAVVFWPRHGLGSRLRQGRDLAARVQREDALKHMLKREVNGQPPTLDGIAGALQVSRNRAATLVADLEGRGLVSHAEGRLQLKPAGQDLALHVIRSHRLWESYLAEQTGVPESRWHEHAERQEHLLSTAEADALSARLGHPAQDPHGDAIPDAGARLPSDRGQSLNTAELNTPLRIVHIEDEPPAIYAQLVAQGLRPDMRVCLLAKSPQRVHLWADGREHVLAPILANNIAVVPLTGLRSEDLFGESYLASLRPGQSARVLGLTPACRGPQRRRLLDLGFVPGTEVAVEMSGPGGDPTAYRVRDTLVALRQEQARLVQITHPELASA